MKVTAETLPERLVKLQIEIEPERHAQAMEDAYKRLAPRVQIPGFRPGKAPRPLIERQLGHHRILDEAMDLLIPIAYREAVEEQDLVPVAQPSVELVSHEPLVFTATVPLQPVIDLGAYTDIRLPRDPAKITDEQVNDSLTELRRRYGTIEPVDRPAQKGDIISGSLHAQVNDATMFREDEIEFRLEDETLASLPGLADAIVGLKKGDKVEKTYDVPADFADGRFAGETVKYTIAVEEVKEEKLANEDDAFAKEVGEGFENLQALRDRVRDDLQKAEDDTILRNYENQVVDALTEQASLEYPEVLVDQEIHRLLDEQANLDPRDPRAVNLYIERMGKSEEEVHESVRPEAELRLRRSLVLSQFADTENISVEDADIDAELQQMADQSGDQSGTILQLFSTGNGRETLRRSLLTRKTLARLVEIAGQEGAAKPATKRTAAKKAETPAATEEPAAEAPKPKARRSTPRASE